MSADGEASLQVNSFDRRTTIGVHDRCLPGHGHKKESFEDVGPRMGSTKDALVQDPT